MIRIFPLSITFFILALPAIARDLPPGIESARLLPGWVDDQGNRVSAFELQLEPGWKTYWRKPGDSGLPPSFDWVASQNLAEVTLHWPAPEAIRSGGDVTLGYHDLLVLPFTASPENPDRPMELRTAIEFAVCEKICVPAYLELQAPPPDSMATPEINKALAKQPIASQIIPSCTINDIDDGVRLSVLLPNPSIDLAAMELDGSPEIWVSSAQLQPEVDGTRATADFVPPSGAPFDPDLSRVLTTVLAKDGATEFKGCSLQE